MLHHEFNIFLCFVQSYISTNIWWIALKCASYIKLNMISNVFYKSDPKEAIPLRAATWFKENPNVIFFFQLDKIFFVANFTSCLQWTQIQTSKHSLFFFFLSLWMTFIFSWVVTLHVGNHNVGVLTLNYRNLEWTDVNGSFVDRLQEADCKSTLNILFSDGVKNDSLFVSHF